MNIPSSRDQLDRVLGQRAVARHVRLLAARQSRRPESWQALLDQAVHGLDEPYKSSVIYCDLEGCTPREAARLLGWRPRRVRTSLRLGRRLLQNELRRAGVFLPGKALVRWLRHSPPLPDQAAAAAVSTRAQRLASWVLSWL